MPFSAKYILLPLLLLNLFAAGQIKKAVYHPCFLMDSVDKNLDFIKLNASRVFTDSFDCKETMLDSISALYVRNKNTKYLDALQTIRINPNAKVEGLYIDVIKRFIEDDFGGFIHQLYVAKGKYSALEKELVATLNMIVGTGPLKQKYMGRMKVEIAKAKDAKDTGKSYYLEKLKKKIEEDKY